MERLQAWGEQKAPVSHQLHRGMDEETLEIRAVGVTTGNVGDAPMLPDLPDQIPQDQDIASVAADGAYDTRRFSKIGREEQFYRHLPEHRRRRRPLGYRRHNRANIFDTQSLSHRPDRITERAELGHWECDLMMFR